MKPQTSTKRHKKFRLKNKEYRNRHRKKNYDKYSVAPRKRKEWNCHEIEWIQTGYLSDREMAHILNRSVRAVQQMRWKIKKGLVKNDP